MVKNVFLLKIDAKFKLGRLYLETRIKDLSVMKKNRYLFIKI